MMKKEMEFSTQARSRSIRLKGLLCMLAVCRGALCVEGAMTFTNLVSFNGDNGYCPLDELVQGQDGSFYGTTAYGGPHTNIVDVYNNFGYGTVFRMTAEGNLSTLFAFSGTNGSLPRGLVQTTEGILFGTTSKGGSFGCGTIFKMTTNGDLTLSVSFAGTNGNQPSAGVVLGSDGNLYGTTYFGGTSNLGTVFRVTTNGELTSLVAFSGTNGANPVAELVQNNDGDFLGTTHNGGIGFNGSSMSGNGTVFKMNSNGDLTVLHRFTWANDGAWPSGNLVRGTDGNYYGPAYAGGSPGNNGAIFQLMANGTVTPFYNAFGGNNGDSPQGGMLQAEDGNFYGSTYFGGTNNLVVNGGTLFKLSPDGVLTTLVSFSGMTGPFPGANPTAALTRGVDGNFYGTTCFRGVNYLGAPTNNGWGSIFRLNVPIPPVIRTTTHGNNTFTFVWNAVAGQKYRVQYETSLTQTNWNDFGDVVTATNGVMSSTDAVVPPQRFYRVVLLP